MSRHRSGKKTRALLSATVVALGLAACAGGQSTDNAPKAVVPSGPPEAGVVAPDSLKGIKIGYGSSGGNFEATEYDQIINGFMETSGAKVLPGNFETARVRSEVEAGSISTQRTNSTR